jgi:tetratricopeptide (TPR) repeat protein
MKCRRSRSQLVGYVDRELTSWRVAALQEHLSECEDCARLHTNLKALHRLVVRDRRALDTPGDLHDAILEAAAPRGASGRTVDLDPVADPQNEPRPKRSPDATVGSIVVKEIPDLHPVRSVPRWRRAMGRFAVLKVAAGLLMAAVLGWGLWHRYAHPPAFGMSMDSLHRLAQQYPPGDMRDLDLLSDKVVASSMTGAAWDAETIACSRIVQVMMADIRTMDDALDVRRLSGLVDAGANRAGIGATPLSLRTPNGTNENGYYRQRVRLSDFAVGQKPRAAIDYLHSLDAMRLDAHDRVMLHLRLADAHLKLGELDSAAAEAGAAAGAEPDPALRKLVDAMTEAVDEARRAMARCDELAAEEAAFDDLHRRLSRQETMADLLLRAGCYRNAADIYKPLIERPGRRGARCLVKLGHAMQQLGEHEVWRGLMEHLCRRKSMPPEFRMLSRVELAAAGQWGANPEPLMAARYYEQALAVCGERWPRARGMLLCNLAHIYFSAGCAQDGRRIVAMTRSDRGVPASFRRIVREIASRHEGEEKKLVFE